MGSIRRRLICAAALLLPAPAFADTCADLRPGWDGIPVSAWGELLTLMQSPLAIFMLIASALAVRFRSEKGGLAVVVGWSIATYLVTGWGRADPDRMAAMAEGCIGSPALIIAVAAAVSIGVVLYTAPLPRRDSNRSE